MQRIETLAGFKRGDRVEVTDRTSKLWLDGYRTGTINMMGGKVIAVRFDKDGKSFPFHPSQITRCDAR
jgi:hypothetical protein